MKVGYIHEAKADVHESGEGYKEYLVKSINRDTTKPSAENNEITIVYRNTESVTKSQSELVDDQPLERITKRTEGARKSTTRSIEGEMKRELMEMWETDGGF